MKKKTKSTQTPEGPPDMEGMVFPPQQRGLLIHSLTSPQYSSPSYHTMCSGLMSVAGIQYKRSEYTIVMISYTNTCCMSTHNHPDVVVHCHQEYSVTQDLTAFTSLLLQASDKSSTFPGLVYSLEESTTEGGKSASVFQVISHVSVDTASKCFTVHVICLCYIP